MEQHNNFEGNQQGQPNYNPYYANMPPEKKDGTAFGVASLVCGFLALIFFCGCINIPLAIISVLLGIVQLSGYKKKWMAALGIACSVASLTLMVIAFVVFSRIHIDISGIGGNGIDSGVDNYEQYFERYFTNEEDDGSF